MKIKICDNPLDLEKASSILLVGKYGTGKTRTIKDILRQTMKDCSRIDVLYVDNHEADYRAIQEIVGDNLINKTCVLTESKLKSLYNVVKAQQEFRNQLICELGVTTLDELVGKGIKTFVINGREYMPDDIVCYHEHGEQKWLLACEYYKKKIENSIDRFTCRQIGEYHPTRLILCFDEFYLSSDILEEKNLIHDIALSIIRFGRVAHQNIILTTQRLLDHKEYSDIYSLASVKAFFHCGLDNEDDYRVLFNKELPIRTYRGCVTIESPDIESIHDNDVVSKLHEAIDEICVGHELEDFSLSDIKMLSQILKRKVMYLDKMFERRLLHIIEVARELDFSDCEDLNISWHIVGQDVIVSVLIHQLPNDYVISAKMLNMSDEDLIKNKDLCKYVG